MTKQNITFLKTQKFIRTYPNILFFQHNNLSVSQWFRLRTQLKTIENVNLLLLKNTLIDNVLAQENVSTPALFQGPCFALGFSNSSRFPDIVKITRQEPTIVLVGGLFDNQFLNHLDIAKIVELDNRVHETLLTNFNQSSHLHEVLTNSLTNPVNQLNQVSWNLLECLEILKLKCQSDKYCLCINIRSQSNRRFPYGYLVTTSLQLSPTLWDLSLYNLRTILVHQTKKKIA
jgi:ribosomal protein L10